MRRNPYPRKLHVDRRRPHQRSGGWPRHLARWEYLELGAVWAISGSALRWVAAALVLCGVILDLVEESLEIFRTQVDWRDRRAQRRPAKAGGKPKSSVRQATRSKAQ